MRTAFALPGPQVIREMTMPDSPVSARMQAALASPTVQRLAPAAAWWLAEIAGLFGDEPRADRADSPLLVQLAGPDIVLSDRRGAESRAYRLDAGAEDLAERLAAIRGSERAPVGVKVLIDPAACFTRTVTLPAQVLPRMREVLAQELEAATPFKADAVHSDWYVESEDAERRLRVRHVILKRSALDPLLATLSGAGLVPGPVVVGRSEDRAIPVDLLCGGRRPVPRLLRRIRPGDLVLLAISALLALSAFGLFRAHQGAALAAIEDATRDARRAAASRLPPSVQAAAVAFAAARAVHPPVALVWSALAALPSDVSAEALAITHSGATVTLLAPDEARALAGTAAIPIFGPGRVQSAAEAPEASARRVVVVLPWREPSR